MVKVLLRHLSFLGLVVIVEVVLCLEQEVVMLDAPLVESELREDSALEREGLTLNVPELDEAWVPDDQAHVFSRRLDYLSQPPMLEVDVEVTIVCEAKDALRAL